MNRSVKVTLVAGVLFGGIALALFFKKDPAGESNAEGDPAAVDLPELTPEEQAAGERGSGDLPAASDPTGGPATDRWAKDTLVPKVSPSFEPSSRRPADSRWNQAKKNDPFSDRPAVSRGDSITNPPRTALKYHVDDSTAPAFGQPARVHNIADGDTLSALALRYYGDATAGGNIFEANRQVLADPDLLPIGRQLRIPPRPANDASELVPVGTK
ncbi:MAG: tail protein X [Planctomycetes bacterium]|nr:tail protein X [Planctomycetota bacterium]